MPSISMFLVCDSINNITPQPNITIPQLVGPQSVLRPQFIPSTFSFGLAVGVAGVDSNVQNVIRFTISNPEGAIIHDSGDNVFPPIGFDDTMPKEYQGFMMSLDIRNLLIEKEGAYSFTLYVNNTEIGRKEIPIFRGRK